MVQEYCLFLLNMEDSLMNTLCSVCAMVGSIPSFGIVCNSSQNRGRFDSNDSLECKDSKKSLLVVLCCVTIDGW